MSVPSDHAITLAAATYGPSWTSADEIRGRLEQWGFANLTNQRVVARLRAMCKEDSPRFESNQVSWASRPFWEYRVTRYGYTELHNRNPGIRCHR